MKDKRVVYGFCTWWGSIYEAGNKGIPCCPYCNSNLMEYPSIEAWNKDVEKHEVNGHPGYIAFIQWLRGKCFKNHKIAAQEYFKETAIEIDI